MNMEEAHNPTSGEAEDELGSMECPVVKVDKATEPEATNVDYEIGTKRNKKGAVKVDKTAEPKTISVDYELDMKLNQKDFFLPASKKRKVQRRTDAVDTILSDCKEMGKGNAPIPKVKKQKEEKRSRSVTSPLKSETGENSSLFQFDLWMEARLAAKENAQLCGGKPTHPFFSQHKVAQQTLVSASVNANLSAQQTSLLDVGELFPSPPFHITQLAEVKVRLKDDQSSSIAILKEKKLVQPLCKRNSIDLDAIELVRLLRPCVGGLSVSRRKEQRPCRPSFDNILDPLMTFLKNHENKSKDEGTTEECFSFSYLENRLNSFSSHNASESVGDSSERRCCHTDMANSTQNLLWTDMYQPQLPEQVCGNREMVGTLDIWLQRWKTRSTTSERDIPHKKVSNQYNCSEDRGWFEDDSDSGSNTIGDEALQNVMFLAGPVGCGKTTAIYTCAKAHGFRVIEVNCSDNRSGMLIKQKFSESMESHRLGKWSADMVESETTFNSTKENFSSAKEFSTETSLRNRPKEEKKVNKKAQANHGSIPKTKKSLSRNVEVISEEQPDISIENEKSMTILLFEDVNMVFEDDRGFMAAVAQLAATAKRPIILTSNGAQVLEFKRPSTKELVVLAYLICAAEGVTCSPEFLLQIVKVCHHDVRGLLNYLQFWCQGRHSTRSLDIKDEDTRITQKTQLNIEFPEVDPGTLIALFALEAQHKLLPVYLPLSFPCEVTVSIASRLRERVSQVESEFNSIEQKKLEQQFVKKRLLKKTKKFSDMSIENLQEGTDAVEILTEQESQLLETPVKNLKEAKTVARSPILRERVKRKLAIVMSDSEDDKDHHQENVHQTSSYHDNNKRDCFDVATDKLLTTTIVDVEPSYSLEEPLVGFKSMLKQADIACLHESITTMWSQLRKSKEEHGFCLSSVSKDSFPIISSVYSLSENLSACDIMSCAHSRKYMHQEGNTFTSCSRIHEHDSLLQGIAELAHHALKLCVQECYATPSCVEEAKGSDILEHVMLISMNDPNALGKVASEGGTLLNLQGFLPEASSFDQEWKRLENRSSLLRDLCSELPPRAQRSLKGEGFFERTSFLSRMVQLDEERSSSLGNRRRGRGCQNYFSTHPWNLSKRSVSALHQLGSFSKTLN